MFGNPLSAKEWGEVLGTTHGKAVYDALRLFHECPIDLKPPVRDLKTRVVAAYRGIGIDTPGIAVIPLGTLMAPAADLHPRLRDVVRWDITQAVLRSLESELGDVLRDRFHGRFQDEVLGLAEDAYGTVITEVAGRTCRPHHDRLASKHPQVFVTTHETMPFELLSCLCPQVALLASGQDADAALLAPFASLFLDGNFPLGLLPDTTSAVLVA